MNLLPGITDIDNTPSTERRSLCRRTHSFKKPRRSTSSSKTLSTPSRVYKAPQALVRNDKYVNTKQPTAPVMGTRRRRRGATAATTTGQDCGTSYMMEADSDSSIGNVDELPAPPLWGDEEDFPRISPYSQKKDSALPQMAWERESSGHKQQQPVSSIQIRAGNEEISENTQFEEELFGAYETHLHLHAHDHSSRCCPPNYGGSHSNNTNKRRSHRWWNISQPYTNLIRICALLMLALFVFDSHHRVHKHKIQLQEYDEERAHILEQMMWIDQAAKKVHQKYASKGGPDILSQAVNKESDESARAALEKLQVRIQLNARDRLAQRFGDKPAEISLKLNDRGEHLIVALSDDTPHAVSTLLEQVEHRLWDTIRVEKASTVGAVQIASTKAATTPLLEFIEPSRGCHEVGSVAIRQQEEDELHVLKLRINLISNSPMDPNDICIGRAVSSLATLQEMATAVSS